MSIGMKRNDCKSLTGLLCSAEMADSKVRLSQRESERLQNNNDAPFLKEMKIRAPSPSEALAYRGRWFSFAESEEVSKRSVLSNAPT